MMLVFLILGVWFTITSDTVDIFHDYDEKNVGESKSKAYTWDKFFLPENDQSLPMFTKIKTAPTTTTKVTHVNGLRPALLLPAGENEELIH